MWMSTDTLGNKKVGIVTLNNGWAVDIKVGREGFGAVDLASAQPFFNSIRRFVE